MRKPILAVAAYAALLSPALADTYKEFGKWTVSCSNGLTCNMQFYSADKAPALSGFRLHRVSAPSAPVTAAFSAAALPETATGVTVTLDVDKDHAVTVDPAKVSFDKDRGEWLITVDLTAQGFIDAMKTGKALHLSAKAGDKIAEADIPLTGVAASLLYIDDVQGRVGQTDALSAKGAKAPAEQAAADEISRFDQFPQAMRPIFSDDGICGGLDETQMSAIGAFVQHLAKDEAIYAAPCGTPGAYNAPFVLYYQTGYFLSQMQFPVMDTNGPSVMRDAYNLDYDTKTRIVTSFFKGRGIGDCGSWYKWKVGDDASGTALILLEQREKDDCDGNYAGGPQKWKASWPPK